MTVAFTVSDRLVITKNITLHSFKKKKGYLLISLTIKRNKYGKFSFHVDFVKKLLLLLFKKTYINCKEL